MFSDKGFADGANVDLSSGSTAVATVVMVTAVTNVGKKRVVNSFVPPTSVIEKPWKQSWIKEIANGLTGCAWQNVPLWIKVPPDVPHRTRSSLRFIRDRLPLLNAANRHKKPE